MLEKIPDLDNISNVSSSVNSRSLEFTWGRDSHGTESTDLYESD